MHKQKLEIFAFAQKMFLLWFHAQFLEEVIHIPYRITKINSWEMLFLNFSNAVILNAFECRKTQKSACIAHVSEKQKKHNYAKERKRAPLSKIANSQVRNSLFWELPIYICFMNAVQG